MNSLESRRRRLARIGDLVFCLGLMSVQLVARSEVQSSQPSLPTERKITVTGFVNPCYKPNKYLVFIDANPLRRYESETKVLGADGRFTFVVDAARLTPGSYFVKRPRT